MEPTHTLCLLNTQISSHGHFVHQLPAVGSCASTGQRPRAHVCPVANKDKIILTKFKRTEIKFEVGRSGCFPSFRTAAALLFR